MKELKQELCSVCKKIETYRKCTECGGIPLCIICEIKHEHKVTISQVMTNPGSSIRTSDQQRT